jgi:hypothetical protein
MLYLLWETIFYIYKKIIMKWMILWIPSEKKAEHTSYVHSNELLELYLFMQFINSRRLKRRVQRCIC